ncbi:hypothetical protein K5D42_02495 [Pseudomonas cichorii]|nr:hypothetical protein [Pseudomonas cichorii]
MERLLWGAEIPADKQALQRLSAVIFKFGQVARSMQKRHKEPIKPFEDRTLDEAAINAKEPITLRLYRL